MPASSRITTGAPLQADALAMARRNTGVASPAGTGTKISAGTAAHEDATAHRQQHAMANALNLNVMVCMFIFEKTVYCNRTVLYIWIFRCKVTTIMCYRAPDAFPKNETFMPKWPVRQQQMPRQAQGMDKSGEANDNDLPPYSDADTQQYRPDGTKTVKIN